MSKFCQAKPLDIAHIFGQNKPMSHKRLQNLWSEQDQAATGCRHPEAAP
ncbi:MAG: hypothetical protein KIH69_006470 [Anaerolineae bacterium]|nr:hypothetical protein [Anaerolineae bacterium]